MAVAKKFEEKANLEEKWYGTKYCSEKIPAEKLESWSNAPLNKNLNLPGPNEFIPSEFDLVRHYHRILFIFLKMRKRKCFFTYRQNVILIII